SEEHTSELQSREKIVCRLLLEKKKSDFITLHAEGIKNVIIELADVKYTDSSGLSALLVGNRIFHEDGGIFVVAAVTDHVMKLIKLSNLDGFLILLPTAEEAIDAVFMNEIENELKASDNGTN